MPLNVKWIFFDLGSTLIDETAADTRRIKEMISGTGVTEEAYREKRLEMIREGRNGDMAAIEHFALTKTPWHSEDEALYPDAAATLAELKRRGYKLGVIANQNYGTEQRLKSWNLLQFFEVIAASAELGMAKPAPAIFEWALKQADCSPQDAVMVGDRMDNDIAPANRLGIHTIHLKRGLGAYYEPQSDDEIPEYSIAMLSELFDLLQKFPYQTAEVGGVKVRYQYGAVMINLQTPRLILRDYTEKDFEAYSRLKMDAETMYYLQDIQLHSVEEARRDFAEVLSDMKSPERQFYFFHMELKDTHEQVGSIGYTVEANTPVGKLVHLGYFTYPRHWGNGYTSEALKKVLEYAFTQDNVYRITTGCLAENKGSERVMQKNGLIKEAEHIDYEWHDGKMKTRLEYRLLKHEWQKLQKAL